MLDDRREGGYGLDNRTADAAKIGEILAAEADDADSGGNDDAAPIRDGGPGVQLPLVESSEDASGVAFDRRESGGIASARDDASRLVMGHKDTGQRRKVTTMQNDRNDWDAWTEQVVAEVDDATWLADPRTAVRTALAKAGPELLNHARSIAYQDAANLGAASQLDDEFSKDFPDLMSSEAGRFAVWTAIRKAAAHPQFTALVRNPRTRPKIFRLVAELADGELGRGDAAAPRRPSDAFAGGPAHPTARPAVEVQTFADGRNAAAMAELIREVRSSGRGTGG